MDDAVNSPATVTSSAIRTTVRLSMCASFVGSNEGGSWIVTTSPVGKFSPCSVQVSSVSDGDTEARQPLDDRTGFGRVIQRQQCPRLHGEQALFGDSLPDLTRPAQARPRATAAPTVDFRAGRRHRPQATALLQFLSSRPDRCRGQGAVRAVVPRCRPAQPRRQAHRLRSTLARDPVPHPRDRVAGSRDPVPPRLSVAESQWHAHMPAGLPERSEQTKHSRVGRLSCGQIAAPIRVARIGGRIGRRHFAPLSIVFDCHIEITPIFVGSTHVVQRNLVVALERKVIGLVGDERLA